MTTTWQKYKNYQEECTTEDYLADEQAYREKINALNKAIAEAPQEAKESVCFMTGAMLGISFVENEDDITQEEYRVYWSMAKIKGVQYRMVENECTAKTRVCPS